MTQQHGHELRVMQLPSVVSQLYWAIFKALGDISSSEPWSIGGIVGIEPNRTATGTAITSRPNFPAQVFGKATSQHHFIEAGHEGVLPHTSRNLPNLGHWKVGSCLEDAASFHLCRVIFLLEGFIHCPQESRELLSRPVC